MTLLLESNPTKNNNSSVTLISLAVRFVLLVGSSLAALTVPGQAHAATCPAALNGWYGLSVTGTSSSGNTKYLIGAISLSGCSIVGGDITVSENNTTKTLVSANGTYISNADGTVTFTITPAGGSTETYNIGYTPIFNEALGIETDTSAIASIDLKAQVFPTFGSHYQFTNYLMRGGWTGSCAGPSGQNSDLNYFAFDGFGNLLGYDRSNGYGSFADNSYNGNYTSTPDGEFTGSLTVAGNKINFSGVVDSDLKEMQYVYYDALHGFDFCTAKLVNTDRPPVAGQ